MATSIDTYGDGYYVDESEPLLSLDKYGEPLVASSLDDYATLLLIRLILCEPGTFQTHPDLGVGLVSKYRYKLNPNMDTLSNEIKSQIEKYLPQFTNVSVRCSLDPDEKVINICITSNQINMTTSIVPDTGEVLTNPSNMKLDDFKN